MNIKTLSVAFLLACSTISCSKFLDKEPENEVSVELIFSDMPGAKSALAGVYNNLFQSDYYNGLRMVYPDLIGGNLTFAAAGRTTLLTLYSFETDADNDTMNKLYSYQYTLLNAINNIIKRVPEIANISTLERNHIMAQAYGLRALVHFDLVQFYAQPYIYTKDASHMGIILAKSTILPKDAQIARSSVAEVYQHIESDLNMADSLFANSKTVFEGNAKIYMNLQATKALQARLALNRGDWQKAYQLSAELLKANYSLYTNAEYVGSWKQANTKESIFELAVPSNYSGNSIGSYYVKDSGNSYYQFAPSQDLLGLYGADDVRATGGIFKYPTLQTAVTSVKLIRLSEIYLIHAEAAAELGHTEEAVVSLNAIRLRGNPKLGAYVFNTKNLLINEILDERRRELCLEGLLYLDLMRRGLSVKRNDCTGTNCNVTFPNDHMVLPIPKQSVLSNNRMIQNPGY